MPIKVTQIVVAGETDGRTRSGVARQEKCSPWCEGRKTSQTRDRRGVLSAPTELLCLLNQLWVNSQRSSFFSRSRKLQVTKPHKPAAPAFFFFFLPTALVQLWQVCHTESVRSMAARLVACEVCATRQSIRRGPVASHEPVGLMGLGLG